jgi:16S rRNA (cytosine1402-N4)-methyltransferase
MQAHIPVLLKEVIENLNPSQGSRLIDATIDGGGHALAILAKIMPGGKLLGIEWDGDLLKKLEEKINNSVFKDNVILVNDSYVNLKSIAEDKDFLGIDGVLFDFGMSSWHLEDAGRGFSFTKDEPLDMRYAEKGELNAQEIINRWHYDDLVEIFKNYGEERFASKIAGLIVEARKKQKIETTLQLAKIIENAVPFWYRRGRLHFATKTFQALRIAVNRELENIEKGIDQSGRVLKTGGRLAIISFHSLEDRIVKNFLRSESKAGRLKIITKKPIRPGPSEIRENPRSRSAKLRIAEKL